MAESGVHNLQTKDSWAEVLKQQEEAADTLYVVDAFATWCGPCKVISPKIVEFAKQYPEVKFYKIDVDELPDVSQELGIRAMPTFLFFKNGKKVTEVVGANPGAIEAAIKKHKGAESA